MLHDFEGLDFVVLLAVCRTAVATVDRTVPVALYYNDYYLLGHVYSGSDYHNRCYMIGRNHFYAAGHSDIWIARPVAVSYHCSDSSAVAG